MAAYRSDIYSVGMDDAALVRGYAGVAKLWDVATSDGEIGHGLRE